MYDCTTSRDLFVYLLCIIFHSSPIFFNCMYVSNDMHVRNEIYPYKRLLLPTYIKAPPDIEPDPRQVLANYHEYDQLVKLGYTTRKIMNELVGHVFQNHDAGGDTRLHDVDEAVYRLCKMHRVYPGCLGYHGYPKSTCLNPDDIVAHGLPLWHMKLETIDILGIDFVTFKNGLYVDVARTLVLKKGDVNNHLTRVTHDASIAAIAACKPGVSIGVVASIFGKYAKENGYTVAHGLHSHFILNTIHGDVIPNTKILGSRNVLMEEGMVMAIEPIFNAGAGKIVGCQDDIAYRTADGSQSAHFEHTIVIEAGGAKIIA